MAHRPIPSLTRAAAPLLSLIAAAGIVLSACGGDAGPKAAVPVVGAAQESPTVSASPAATPTAATTAFPVATAQMLPVTPVNIDYRVADPRFDALPGARAFYGEYAGGGYQIEAPDRWNGTVVYFAHGFRGNPPNLTISTPPIREYLIAHGYAWAASSYTKNGYEPGAAARDTYALRDVVASKLGTPAHSYLYGQSMGGHVVALSLEEYPTAYDGAISECGVVTGHEILDYFLSYGALAGYLTGTDLTAAAGDAPTLGTRLKQQVAPALGPYNDLSVRGKAFVNVIEHLTGGPRPFFTEGLAANFNFNFVILVNAAGTAGPSNAAAQNLDTRYAISDGLGFTSDQINREITRVSANSLYRDPATYPEFAAMTGKIQRPMLTLHGTGDLFVPISLEQSYRRIVDAAGSGDLLVQRAIRRPGHCNFSDAERERGFEDLVAWAEGGPKPAGENLQGDLSDAGRQFTTPFADGDPGGMGDR